MGEGERKGGEARKEARRQGQGQKERTWQAAAREKTCPQGNGGGGQRRTDRGQTGVLCGQETQGRGRRWRRDAEEGQEGNKTAKEAQCGQGRGGTGRHDPFV